jgi:ethanolamine utilization protein EutQ (cupin superfamily)
VTEVTFQAGAKWSNDLKPHAGTDLCELPHVALVMTGTLRVVLSDGSQEDFSAGDVMLLPPGHDAWSVGDAACTFVEFSAGNDYYA